LRLLIAGDDANAPGANAAIANAHDGLSSFNAMQRESDVGFDEKLPATQASFNGRCLP
jgi:hypothetical protein